MKPITLDTPKEKVSEEDTHPIQTTRKRSHKRHPHYKGAKSVYPGIDKGVPIPPPKKRENMGANFIYPFAHMVVGDSFMIYTESRPGVINTKRPPIRVYRAIQTAIGTFKKQAPRVYGKWEFTTRTLERGVRCWRTK